MSEEKWHGSIKCSAQKRQPETTTTTLKKTAENRRKYTLEQLSKSQTQAIQKTEQAIENDNNMTRCRNKTVLRRLLLCTRRRVDDYDIMT